MTINELTKSGEQRLVIATLEESARIASERRRGILRRVIGWALFTAAVVAWAFVVSYRGC